jgi:hypothetical protein
MLDCYSRTEELLTMSLEQLKKSHLLHLGYNKVSDQMNKDYQVSSRHHDFCQ